MKIVCYFPLEFKISIEYYHCDHVLLCNSRQFINISCILLLIYAFRTASQSSYDDHSAQNNDLVNTSINNILSIQINCLFHTLTSSCQTKIYCAHFTTYFKNIFFSRRKLKRSVTLNVPFDFPARSLVECPAVLSERRIALCHSRKVFPAFHYKYNA